MDATVQTEDGYLPIPAVVSKEIDNLAILYGDSNGDTWNALAFQINQINRRTHRVSNLPRLGPGESLDFGFLGENGHSSAVSDAGNDKLRIDSDRSETIVEYGIAIKPDGLLVGVENPAGETVTGVLDNDRLRGYEPDAANSSDFEDFGSIRSETTHTAARVPTTALSETPHQGLVRFDKEEGQYNNTYFGFLNQREDEVSLEVVAHGVSYKVTPVTDTDTVRDIVYGNGHRRRVLTYGGLGNTSPKRPQGWRRGEVTLTADDTLAQLNGGGA